MHGEFKSPGGKLVVADVEVREGRLARVIISGDFFLYPEDVIFLIHSALEGASSAAPADELASRIRSALPAGAELLGTSPEAIAEAVRRALA